MAGSLGLTLFTMRYALTGSSTWWTTRSRCRSLRVGLTHRGSQRLGTVLRLRLPPQVAEHAAEGADGDHEQYRAGVLGEGTDHARSEAAGERGEPRGVAGHRCQQ